VPERVRGVIDGKRRMVSAECPCDPARMTRLFRSLGLGAALASLVGAALVTGAGTAQAADLHYQCERVIAFILLPHHLNGMDCSWPVATGWGTVTETLTGKVYSCDYVNGHVLNNELWVVGQNCDLM
jgi:hypothetical protein